MKLEKIYSSIILFILLTGCNRKVEYQEYSIKELVYEMEIYSIDDSLSKISNPAAIRMYKDSLVIFADFYNNSMFKWDLGKNLVEKIGNNGKGPGEYLSPYGLFIKDRFIYYSDSGERGLEKFDFNGKNFKRINSAQLDLWAPAYFTVNNDSTIYFLNDFTKDGYFVHSSDGRKYGKVPYELAESGIKSFYLSGIYMNNDHIYFQYRFYPKIQSVNLRTGAEELILIDEKGFFNWQNMNKYESESKFYEMLRKEYSRIGDLSGFQHKGETYFCIHVYNERTGGKYLVCNSSGEILFSIKIEDESVIFSIDDEKAYIFKVNKNECVVKKLVWNELSKSLLK